MSQTTETLELRGVLKGHNGWVTCIASLPSAKEGIKRIISGSRDKKLIIWELENTGDVATHGLPVKSLEGHSHFVQDVAISSDGLHALSASWDTTLRLWDLTTGETTRRFIGHSKDVLSVDFSASNTKIVSGSRDKTIKLWNTLGECKWTTDQHNGGHLSWVSSIKCSPDANKPVVVTGGWDHSVKVWDLTDMKLLHNLVNHTGYVNCVAISPDGSLCASGGKDGIANLWGLGEGKHLYKLEAGTQINTLVFSPNRYWLVAGTDTSIIIWNLETKTVVAKLNQDSDPEFFAHEIVAVTKKPACLSLAWSSNGSTLYAGYSDHLIRVWEVTAI